VGVGRRFAIALLLALVGLPVAVPSALARPTITLAPACHDQFQVYAFRASLSGFPPNLPFDVDLHYSGTDHSFNGVLSTDASGSFSATQFGDVNPLGPVTVTVHAPINGASATFTATLDDPCDPPLSLPQAMCGGGNYRTLLFANLRRCKTYANRVAQASGGLTSQLILRPACKQSPGNRYGFTVEARGISPGTSVQASLSYSGFSLNNFATHSGRFAIVGPIGFSSSQPVGKVTASVVVGSLTLTAQLTDPCV
jgi:hypothetical protein